MSQNLRNKRKNDQEGYDKHDITDRACIYWLNKAGIKPAQIGMVMDILTAQCGTLSQTKRKTVVLIPTKRGRDQSEMAKDWADTLRI
jgi:hypothetical protein